MPSVSYSTVLQCQLVWMLWYMTRPADLMTVGPGLHLLCYKVSVLVNGFWTVTSSHFAWDNSLLQAIVLYVDV